VLRPIAFAAVGLALAWLLPQEPEEPRSTTPLAAGLSFADARTIAAPHDFLRGFPTNAAPDLIHAVVEIPAGTNEKWEVGRDGKMRWDIEDGRVRVVRYLGYPANYGIVPRTLLGREQGGDGDPLDVIVLGPSLPRGTVLAVRPIGVIELVDKGDQDDKILAVAVDGPFSAVDDLAELDLGFAGVTAIVRTWFENYKGRGKLQCGGFGDRAAALALIERCARTFAAGEKE